MNPTNSTPRSSRVWICSIWVRLQTLIRMYKHFKSQSRIFFLHEGLPDQETRKAMGAHFFHRPRIADSTFCDPGQVRREAVGQPEGTLNIHLKGLQVSVIDANYIYFRA